MKNIPNRVRLSALAGASLIAIIAVAGCGSSNSSPPPTATPMPATPTPAAQPTKASTGGKIIFGAALKGGTVSKPNNIFKNPKTLAWVAHFSPAASAGKATVAIVRTSGPHQHPLTVWSYTIQLPAGAQTASTSVTGAQLKAHQVISNGTYSVTYSQGSTTLATATIDITNSSGGGGTSY